MTAYAPHRYRNHDRHYRQSRSSTALIAISVLFACVTQLVSCASEQASSAPSGWVGPSPEALVAEIRAAQNFQGDAATPGELEVQPLRDPAVEDLRQKAVQFENQHNYAQAAAALDKALAISPNDPALLQERAEAALLQKDIAKADALAQRAYEMGSKVGPLCRRHWATVREIRAIQYGYALAEHPKSRKPEDAYAVIGKRESLLGEVEQAKRAIEACTLTGPPRY